MELAQGLHLKVGFPFLLKLGSLAHSWNQSVREIGLAVFGAVGGGRCDTIVM